MRNKYVKKFAILIGTAAFLVLTNLSPNSGYASMRLADQGAPEKLSTDPAPESAELQNMTDNRMDCRTILELRKDTQKSGVDKLVSLLGIGKEQLMDVLQETPDTIDEGGLEFKKAGIRVWFDQKSHEYVDQIFIMNKNIDINGLKTGDDIGKFKQLFGKPISDINGDAHFRYKDVFLSVNYDKDTGKSIAVYLLKNNF